MRDNVFGLMAVVLAITASAETTSPPPAPCSSAAHRQFDFWLGNWEVRTPDGELAGRNRITRAFGGCVLHEQYDTGRGYSGASFNTYDASRGRWHQTWVDSGGMLLQLDGGLVDGRMVLGGETVAADGGTLRHTITWAPNADGTVRQTWAVVDPGGTRRVVFDGLYVPAAAAPAGSQRE